MSFTPFVRKATSLAVLKGALSTIINPVTQCGSCSLKREWPNLYELWFKPLVAPV